jgi:hypothetical protein
VNERIEQMNVIKLWIPLYSRLARNERMNNAIVKESKNDSNEKETGGQADERTIL